jgi:tetratricopeptide (TPR) repeat protein
MNPEPSGVPPGEWKPEPLTTAGVELPLELHAVAEELARHNHDAWAHERLDEGWRYGPARDDGRKQHPCLVPYEQLPESEKAVDRNSALEVMRWLVVRGYHITRSTVPERVDPRVLEYQTSAFVLREELARLELAMHVKAPEAAIFYSARVLEALSAQALRNLGPEPADTVFANLQILEDLGQMGTALRYWAHALRRLGNRVRHVQAKVGPRDAALAALFAESWLEWFFESYKRTGGLRALTVDGQPLWPAAPLELTTALRSLEELEELYNTRPPEKGVVPDVSPAVYEMPVTAAVLADIVLARCDKGDPAPLRVLERALPRFPRDLRLRQVMGLYWSREGQPAQALEWLKPLLAEYPNDDETIGITAGAYKKLWRQDPKQTDYLHHSHRAYLNGWKESSRKNAYLGINAATTALWLGHKSEASRLAGEVQALLEGRAQALPLDVRERWLHGDYWPWVTLAEARLLQGDWQTAKETYGAAFAYHHARKGDISATKAQLDEILRALGLPPMDL